MKIAVSDLDWASFGIWLGAIVGALVIFLTVLIVLSHHHHSS